MEQFVSNFTAPKGQADPAFHTLYVSFNDSDQLSRTGRWMYFLAIPTVISVSWSLWTYVLRLWLLRRYYEKQGIQFVKQCYAVVGAEMRVSGLQQKNKSHDWLYTDRPSDLYGTVRGFSVQLYSTDAELSENLIAKTGKHVDRDSPALFSFGRLSPYALTFLPTHKWRWKERKANLTRGAKDNQRLYEIVSRQAEQALAKFKIRNGSGVTIDIRELLNHWTRHTAGEYIWGKNNINRYVKALGTDGQVKHLPYMTALNHTFTELRFYAGWFWNRVCFPLAIMPLTKESRRLDYNIKLLRKEIDAMMLTPEADAVAANVQDANAKLGIPIWMTRDDLVAATIAGLDTIRSTTMGTIFHLLDPKNFGWRKQLLDEINELKAQPGEMYSKLMIAPKLDAFIRESMRYEPPGSLINNAAVKDFDLSYRGRTYKIKSGTRIVSCIHALHLNEDSWKQRVADDMTPLSEFDPNRFLRYGNDITSSFCWMPFGKGPRRCPGQAAGTMMVKAFLAAFVTNNFNCRMVVPETQSKDNSWFNINSKATFDIVCDDEAKAEEDPTVSQR